MDATGPDISSVIPARSKRQVMDWSLVLASQDIHATILHNDDDDSWALVVEAHEAERAQSVLRQYRLENRKWHWEQPIPWSKELFHWGGLAWSFLLIWIHWITWNSFPGFREAARFDRNAVAHGEWWRVFTAIWLHADLGHLLANATIGFVLFGLAMARYGAGTALLAAYLAGAIGNVAGFIIYRNPYIGLGASGMVMGALGLIAIPPLANWSWHPRSIKHLAQAIFASVMLFVLLGVDPASDVIAHLGGFIAGVVFGLLLNLSSPKRLQRSSSAGLEWLTLVILVAMTTWLAFRKM